MRALVVQPPFAQLNAPYPAAFYLESFLRKRGIEAEARDHSIELYRALFSRAGLGPVFAAARALLGQSGAGGPGARALDPAARSQLERYVSYEAAYLEWVEAVADFLAGGDSGFAHRLAAAAELPLGARAEALLESRGGGIESAEAPLLATKILEDLGDLVAFAYDPLFETVRYGERLAASRADFAEIASAAASSPIMRDLYRPYLARGWATGPAATLGDAAAQAAPPELLLVTIPFPGALIGALACARFARETFGGATAIAFGGGYVTTELRGIRDPGIFDYCDYLAFDAGYGALDSLLEVAAGAPRSRLYRCMFRDGDRIVCAGFPPGDSAREAAPRAAGAASAAAAHGAATLQGAAAPDPWPPRLAADCDEEPRLRAAEAEAVASTFPDYRGADFRRYLAAADSANPMHRLWSGAPWLKYHLARGCYWRRCSFCDTELEYVAGYAPADLDALCDAMDSAAARTGLHGIHFVDEAMPMGRLLAFARRNRARAAAGERPYHFWGNARFDVSWTPDRCAFLAASGLVAVSGGVEIASERGLEMTGKGFDLAGLVRALAALKAAGILVHAYLIYGFPGQREADILESAEICRQLFAAGLVDSAFWHRFTLTRHSRMLADKAEGGWPALAPTDRPWGFANNDMAFRGEAEYDRYEGPLSLALAAWMEGRGLDEPADSWFDAARGEARRGRRPAALPDPGLVEGLLGAAEERAAAECGEPPDPRARAFWISGAPLVAAGSRKGAAILRWACRGELLELGLPSDRAADLAARLAALAASPAGLPLGEALGDPLPDARALAALREGGLVLP